MPYTQEDLDALDAEIATVRLIKQRTHGDRSTTFRSVEELLILRGLMAIEIAGGSRTRYAAYDRDLG